MSREKKVTELNGMGTPIFPSQIDVLNDLIADMVLDTDILKNAANSIRCFKYADRITTADGYRWLSGLRFILPDGQIVVAFPWRDDVTLKDKSRADRSIAVYLSGVVRNSILFSILNDLTDNLQKALKP